MPVYHPAWEALQEVLMPLCTCGHEDHEHGVEVFDGDCTFETDGCERCSCEGYTERPGYARTTSFADLPVSQGARDLYERVGNDALALDTLDILAAADEKDVRNLLWARRVGRL